MMSSGSSDVCDEDESDDVVPPCPMLWLDEVRNAGKAVEYVTQPRRQWASQTSQSAYNKLNYAGAAREQGCDGWDTKGSLCSSDSYRCNETGNHVVEGNVTVEDSVTESVYDLIIRVDTAEEYCCQSAQLISKFIVNRQDSYELMVEKLDSEEKLMIVDKQDSEQLIVDNQDSNVLVADNLDSEEFIVDKQDSEKIIVDTKDSNVLVADNLDSEELIVKQDSSILVVDKLDSEELIVDKLDSEELIVDKLDSNEDDRPACVNVESIDDIRSELSELLHLELSKDTNDGDKETTQNIIGVDHLSQGVVQEAAQKPEVQDLSLNLSVSKTDTRRKSTTNLHVEMDIAPTAVNVHMQIDDPDRGHLKPDQHLALDMCYSKSLNDLVHHHAIPDSQFDHTKSGRPASGLYEAGMLLKVPSDHVGLTKVNVKVHVQKPPSEGLSTVGHKKKSLTYSGLVNPGFKPEDDDDEAIYITKQLKDSYPVEVWSQTPAEAYNYDSEIKIDDGYSDLGDTNDDIRDFRCGDEADDAVEEIDPLVNVEAEGGDRTGCEVDTNQDMRPVCENMAAFDHLSSEVTGDKRIDICSRSNTQVDCGLRVSDIYLHFSVSNNSLKIDLALKSPDSPGLSEDRRLDNLPIADCSSCAMKIEERLQTDGALKVQCPCHLKGSRDQTVLHKSITGAAAHLYSDELYVSTDSIEGQDGSLESTIDATSGSYESLHYVFSPHGNRHRDSNEGLHNGLPPAVYESHECTSCQNFMLSNRKGKLSLTVDDVGGLNCCPRNKKTLTRSTHLDCPTMALHPDIHVQKTMIVPSYSELGELSAAICTRDIMSASGSLGAVANENVAGSSAHASEWSDMAACAVTGFDTVFWVCLVVVIFLFEMYKCYWLFLLPSCLFILSVLVSDNPKPNE